VIDAESRFANSTRIGGAGLVGALLTLAIALMAVLAPSASAVDNGHAYSFSFSGPSESPLGTFIGNVEVDNSAGPSNGAVYVADFLNSRIVKYSASGDFVLMFGDEVNADTGGDVCTALSGDECKAGNSTAPPNGLGSVYKLAVDQVSGFIYASQENRISKYDENGSIVAAFGSGGSINGATSPGGEFSEIKGIDVNGAGDLLINTSCCPGRIVRFNSSGTYQSEYSVGFGVFSGLAWSPKGFNYITTEGGYLRRVDAATGANGVNVSPRYWSLNGGLAGDIEADTGDGTAYAIHSTNGAGDKIAEWRFDGANQPLNADGSPCATTLTSGEPGCFPTHEFGEGSTNDPEGLGTRGSNQTLAVNAATDTVYVGAQVRLAPGFEAGSFRGQINAYIDSPEAVATTGPPTANKTVSGTADPDGAGDIVDCRFEYGPTKNYGSSTPCSPGGTISSETAVTADLTLTNEQTYNYRLVLENEAGAVSFGANQTITPHNVLGVETLSAEEVKRGSVKMRGSFHGDGTATTFWFRWGTTTSYSGGESAHLPAGSSTFPPAEEVSATATGLTTNTLYHYQVVFQNPNGITFGNDQTFTTPEAVKSLSTLAPSEVLRKTAKMNGTFLGDATEGEGDIEYWFEWGKSTNYTASTPVQTTTPPGTINPTVLLTGCGETGTDPGTCLFLETTYHFRLVAQNELGTTFGADQQFTTLPAVGNVTTLPATDISDASVTLHGEFAGNSEATEYWFEYGPTTAYGLKTDPVPAGSPAGATQVESDATEFTGFTTYHYRLVAKNPVGQAVGQDLTFEAPDPELPVPGATEASNISATAATLSAEINPNRWATVYSFEYGPDTEYGEFTVLDEVIDGNLNDPVPVSADIAGLAPGTTYHVRVVAINLIGTAAGPDTTFTTPDLPGIEGIDASAVTSSGAHLSGSVVPNSSPTSVHFEYGAGAGFPSQTAVTPVGADTVAHSVGADLTGLAPSTTYHYRLIAGNGVGSSTSQVGTFTPAALPTIAQPPQPKTVKCKKRFVKRKGKCVKRKKRKHHKKKSHKGGRNG